MLFLLIVLVPFFCIDFVGLRCKVKAQLLICSGSLAGNCQVLSTPRHFSGKFQLDCLKGVLLLFKLVQSFLIISKSSWPAFFSSVDSRTSLFLVNICVNKY